MPLTEQQKELVEAFKLGWKECGESGHIFEGEVLETYAVGALVHAKILKPKYLMEVDAGSRRVIIEVEARDIEIAKTRAYEHVYGKCDPTRDAIDEFVKPVSLHVLKGD